MTNIKTINNEPSRGCGKRKPGGIYLIASEWGSPCGKLPIPLNRCPCCAAGIKFARGWTWIAPRPLIAAATCQACPNSYCNVCPVGGAIPERAGLLWIGEQFYQTPTDFNAEAEAQGVSRRIKSIPHDFVLGETWVYLAHIKAAHTTEGDACPGLFTAFKPIRIEYILKGDESLEALDQLERRGFTLIKLTYDEPQAVNASIEAEEASHAI